MLRAASSISGRLCTRSLTVKPNITRLRKVFDIAHRQSIAEQNVDNRFAHYVSAYVKSYNDGTTKKYNGCDGEYSWFTDKKTIGLAVATIAIVYDINEYIRKKAVHYNLCRKFDKKSEKHLNTKKSKEEKALADQKAKDEKALADQKAKDEKALADQKVKEEKAERDAVQKSEDRLNKRKSNQRKWSFEMKCAYSDDGVFGNIKRSRRITVVDMEELIRISGYNINYSVTHYDDSTLFNFIEDFSDQNVRKFVHYVNLMRAKDRINSYTKFP